MKLSKNNENLVIAEILRPHGIKGEVKVKPLTDDAGRFLKLKKAVICGNEFEIEKAGVNPSGVFLYLKGVETREAAEKLRGKLIEVSRADAVKPPEGKHFIVDLIGCEVFAGEEKLSALADILQTAGTADVYVLANGTMFPAVKDVFLEIDTENKKIILNPKRFKEISINGG